jgi:hypothetical protein
MRPERAAGKRPIYRVFGSLGVSDKREDISGGVDNPLDGDVSKQVAIENHIISVRQDVGVGR